MRSLKKKITMFTVLAWLAFFVVPWQTRYIFYSLDLQGVPFEYGQFSLYISTLAMIAALGIWSRKILWKQGSRISLFLILSLLIIGLWAQQPLMVLYGVYLTSIGIGYYLLTRTISWQVIYSALITGGVIQALFGFFQYSYQWVPPNKWLGLAQHMPDVLGQSVVVANGLRILRAYGSFTHPNILGGFLVVTIILTILWQIKRPHLRGLEFFILNVALGLQILGLVVSLSRSAWLALGLWLVVISFWMSVRQAKQSLGVLLYSVAIIVTVVSLLSFSLSDIFVGRISADDRLEQISVSTRISEYQDAAYFLTQPFTMLGLGWGNYPFAVASVFPDRNLFDYQPLHNTYVLIFLELGVFGLAFFVMIVRKISWVAVIQSPILALCVIALFDHWLVSGLSGIALVAISSALASQHQTK